MIEDLAWLGIEWTPPILVQSQRIALYREAFARLLASGFVYPCTCSRRDLAQMVQAPHEEADDEPVYDGHCRPLAEASSTARARRQLSLPCPRWRDHSLHRSQSRPAELHRRPRLRRLPRLAQGRPPQLSARLCRRRCSTATSPKSFAEPICSSPPHGRSFCSARSTCNRLHTSTPISCATTTACGSRNVTMHWPSVLYASRDLRAAEVLQLAARSLLSTNSASLAQSLRRDSSDLLTSSEMTPASSSASHFVLGACTHEQTLELFGRRGRQLCWRSALALSSRLQQACRQHHALYRRHQYLLRRPSRLPLADLR